MNEGHHIAAAPGFRTADGHAAKNADLEVEAGKETAHVQA